MSNRERLQALLTEIEQEHAVFTAEVDRAKAEQKAVMEEASARTAGAADDDLRNRYNAAYDRQSSAFDVASCLDNMAHMLRHRLEEPRNNEVLDQ